MNGLAITGGVLLVIGGIIIAVAVAVGLYRDEWQTLEIVGIIVGVVIALVGIGLLIYGLVRDNKRVEPKYDKLDTTASYRSSINANKPPPARVLPKIT
jgi:cytochrome c biogenesis protein CcdA